MLIKEIPEDFIVEEDNVVIVSRDGWVKRQKEVRDLAATRLREGDAEALDVAGVLTGAAKGGRATAGLEATLEAASRGAVYRLYVLATFRETGRQCGACGALQPGDAPACRVCRGATKEVELGEALVQRVLATGGAVQTVAVAAGLERAGGVAAQLRYPL